MLTLEQLKQILYLLEREGDHIQDDIDNDIPDDIDITDEQWHTLLFTLRQEIEERSK